MGSSELGGVNGISKLYICKNEIGGFLGLMHRFMRYLALAGLGWMLKNGIEV